MTERKLLTDVECEVLDCAAKGMTMQQTADARGRSYYTILTQRKMILAKLAARNMAEAIDQAHELGLLGRY